MPAPEMSELKFQIFKEAILANLPGWDSFFENYSERELQEAAAAWWHQVAEHFNWLALYADRALKKCEAGDMTGGRTSFMSDTLRLTPELDNIIRLQAIRQILLRSTQGDEGFKEAMQQLKSLGQVD